MLCFVALRCGRNEVGEGDAGGDTGESASSPRPTGARSSTGSRCVVIVVAEARRSKGVTSCALSTG